MIIKKPSTILVLSFLTSFLVSPVNYAAVPLDPSESAMPVTDDFTSEEGASAPADTSESQQPTLMEMDGSPLSIFAGTDSEPRPLPPPTPEPSLEPSLEASPEPSPEASPSDDETREENTQDNESEPEPEPSPEPSPSPSAEPQWMERTIPSEVTIHGRTYSNERTINELIDSEGVVLETRTLRTVVHQETSALHPMQGYNKTTISYAYDDAGAQSISDELIEVDMATDPSSSRDYGYLVYSISNGVFQSGYGMYDTYNYVTIHNDKHRDEKNQIAYFSEDGTVSWKTVLEIEHALYEDGFAKGFTKITLRHNLDEQGEITSSSEQVETTAKIQGVNEDGAHTGELYANFLDGVLVEGTGSWKIVKEVKIHGESYKNEETLAAYFDEEGTINWKTLSKTTHETRDDEVAGWKGALTTKVEYQLDAQGNQTEPPQEEAIWDAKLYVIPVSITDVFREGNIRTKVVNGILTEVSGSLHTIEGPAKIVDDEGNFIGTRYKHVFYRAEISEDGAGYIWIEDRTEWLPEGPPLET